MAAMVQTLPQQTGTVTMLQTRPSSSSGSFASPSQASQHQSSRGQPASRGTYNTMAGPGSYRGHQAMAPVAPYAFTSTPGLANTNNSQNRPSWSPHLRPESRASSAPSVPQGSQNIAFNGNNPQRMHHLAAGSVSTSSSSNSSLRSYVSKDDTAIPSRQRAGDLAPRPLSTVNLPTSSFMNISSPTISSKPSPDRYRRGNRRADNTAGTQNPAGATAASGPTAPASASTPDQTTQVSGSSPSSMQRPFLAHDRSAAGHVRVSSADDTRSERVQHPEFAKRYRRRSWATMDTTGLASLRGQTPSPQENALVDVPDLRSREERPQSRSSHSHNGSTESIQSTRSSAHSARSASINEEANSNSLRTPEIPKRSNNPSPLSNPVTMSPVSAVPDSTPSAEEGKEAITTQSSAAQRLAEITKSEQKKSGKSRLRRAFSFGSASELRRVSAQNNFGKKDVVEAEKSRKQLLSEELGAEQAAIAERQEASGLGESIYSHQGRFFSGSTDNLSISSTASSASVMLRKMGKGMKRSTRSLVGLFRPKSLVNPTDPVVIEPMAPQVSVVNIEAERKSVAVNPEPQDQSGGGTVFPKLDGASTDPTKAGSLREGSSGDSSRARRSIVGGEKERAEVLAAVRKGILKRTGTDSGNSSPVAKPVEPKGGDLNLPHVPRSNASSHSSAPSTPDDQPSRSGHRRTDTVKIEGEDYFLSVGRFMGPDAKSAPITPQAAVRNIVFSPRIQFHETWPSGEYDRRGDIATCNRLTPLLAQQIKEELNTFKMEMEVHETSKVYTHFL